MNLVQMGFSMIMGWVIVFVSIFIQSIINPGGEEMFWAVLLLGLSLAHVRAGLGFIKKEGIIGTHKAKTLLQIGAVVTIIWVMIFIQREGPCDLGLPKPYITVGYTPYGVPVTTPLVIVLFMGFPIMGLILLALGIVLSRRRKS